MWVKIAKKLRKEGVPEDVIKAVVSKSLYNFLKEHDRANTTPMKIVKGVTALAVGIVGWELFAPLLPVWLTGAMGVGFAVKLPFDIYHAHETKKLYQKSFKDAVGRMVNTHKTPKVSSMGSAMRNYGAREEASSKFIGDITALVMLSLLGYPGYKLVRGKIAERPVRIPVDNIEKPVTNRSVSTEDMGNVDSEQYLSFTRGYIEALQESRAGDSSIPHRSSKFHFRWLSPGGTLGKGGLKSELRNILKTLKSGGHPTESQMDVMRKVFILKTIGEEYPKFLTDNPRGTSEQFYSGNILPKIEQLNMAISNKDVGALSSVIPELIKFVKKPEKFFVPEDEGQSIPENPSVIPQRAQTSDVSSGVLLFRLRERFINNSGRLNINNADDRFDNFLQILQNHIPNFKVEQLRVILEDNPAKFNSFLKKIVFSDMPPADKLTVVPGLEIVKGGSINPNRIYMAREYNYLLDAKDSGYISGFQFRVIKSKMMRMFDKDTSSTPILVDGIPHDLIPKVYADVYSSIPWYKSRSLLSVLMRSDIDVPTKMDILHSYNIKYNSLAKISIPFDDGLEANIRGILTQYDTASRIINAAGNSSNLPNLRAALNNWFADSIGESTRDRSYIEISEHDLNNAEALWDYLSSNGFAKTKSNLRYFFADKFDALGNFLRWILNETSTVPLGKPLLKLYDFIKSLNPVKLAVAMSKSLKMSWSNINTKEVFLSWLKSKSTGYPRKVCDRFLSAMLILDIPVATGMGNYTINWLSGSDSERYRKFLLLITAYDLSSIGALKKDGSTTIYYMVNNPKQNGVVTSSMKKGVVTLLVTPKKFYDAVAPLLLKKRGGIIPALEKAGIIKFGRISTVANISPPTKQKKLSKTHDVTSVHKSNSDAFLSEEGIKIYSTTKGAGQIKYNDNPIFTFNYDIPNKTIKDLNKVGNSNSITINKKNTYNLNKLASDTKFMKGVYTKSHATQANK